MMKISNYFYIACLSAGLLFGGENPFEEKSFSSEKKLGEYIASINEKISETREKIRLKYKTALALQEMGAKEGDYQTLLKEINDLRGSLKDLELSWRERSLAESKKEEEGYAFWDQEETTLSQIIIEYGSNDYLYVIPPEMASMKLNMHSTLPIPRESWSDLLEVILTHNGIGVKQVNPFSRQLYFFKNDLAAPEIIASNIKDLDFLSNETRVIYIFTPLPEQVRSVMQFFDRFRDPKRTFVHQVGHKLALVSSKDEIMKLITLYQSIWEENNEKITKVINVSKLTPGEMEKILKAYFGDAVERNRFAVSRGSEELTILTLAKEAALVLVGVRDVVDKAEKIIKSTEGQIEAPCEMTLYWYTCRHSDPIDLSDILEKVYNSLICTLLTGKDEGQKDGASASAEVNIDGRQVLPPTYGPPPAPPVVHPPVALAGTISQQAQKSTTTNFIPDPKTGSIMMVVRRDTLERLKDIIKKLDVPKKLVEIEVLLFEKKTNLQNRFGLNMFKMGSAAKNVHETGLSFDTSLTAPIRGLLDFFVSRPKKGFPAFDIVYNFLMTQEDIQIKDAPTILTTNQTPATISVVDEISINNGAAPLETNTGITFEKSFSRAQYGTTIVITPTVHEPLLDDEENESYISLETNVTFDTTRSDVDDRPNVNRRHIENHVRVLDGQTVILGGLRRKMSDDTTEKIPFLGEIPGIAKFFGNSKMTDQLTEMFIFITPRLIIDPKNDLVRMRDAMARKRAGDIPEFLERIEYAKRCEKKKIFERSFKLIFGNGC